MSRAKEAFKLWFIGALLIFAVNMLRCNKAIPQSADTVDVRFADLGPDRGGVTICNDKGKPEIIMHERSRYLASFPAILAHEMTHVRQMRKLGCKKAQKKYNKDAQFRFEMETEAYCVQLQFVRNEFYEVAERDFTLFLLVKYQTKMSNQKAVIYIHEVCEKTRTTSPDGTFVAFRIKEGT